MINVTFGNNLSRSSELVNPATTIRTFCEANMPNYASSTITLDGSSLRPGDMDKTFADFGITERCYLLSIQKQDNA